MRTLTALSLCLLPLTLNAKTTSATHADFDLPEPPGMCVLEGKTEAEQLLVDFITMGNMGANEVITVFADCKQLEDFREEKRGDLTYYGSITIPQTEEKYAGTRKEYIKEARAALDKQSELLGAMGISRAKEAGDKTTDRMDLMGFGIEDAEFLGEVGASGETVQIGTVQTNKTPGGDEPKKVAGVATMSLIKGEQIVVNMHALYEGKDTIDALKTYSDSYYKKLIKAND